MMGGSRRKREEEVIRGRKKAEENAVQCAGYILKV